MAEITIPALLVVLGIGSGATMSPAPTVELHHFDRSDVCTATAEILQHRARRELGAGGDRVVAFCIPAGQRAGGR